ncbi:uncharacterized protein LOC132169423 [Corylus avellana]|uniref:uncharacterized protein LOC132169423 n=1 Tax=Corylus avellana TaxID=13451 RepID=UPI00286A5AA6|nr:uncharacterized protein LOC132169423 [Corylus avellana]
MASIRGVVQNKFCPIYETEDETVEHILWNCPSANDVWGCGMKKLQKGMCVGKPFTNLFEEVMEQCDTAELEVLVVTARRIWLRINVVVHGESFMDPTQLAREAQEALEEFYNVTMPEEVEPKKDGEQSMGKWMQPLADYIKMNWDVAVDVKNGWIVLGCITRNLTSAFLAARSITKEVEPAMAKALAAVYATQLPSLVGSLAFGRLFLKGMLR